LQQVRPPRGHSPIEREIDSKQPRDSAAANVLRARRGDRDAEEWIAHRAYTAGLRLATFSLGDPTLAQDVAQEVALRVLTKLPKLRDADRFDAWTYRICGREIKRAAKRRRQAVGEYGVASEPQGDPDFPENLGARDWLSRALPELSDRQRLVLGLRYVYDLDDEEIAAAIGARRGTVRSLASRGPAELRRLAAAEEGAAAMQSNQRGMEAAR
jgi:RNA polymerase sigma factor (sigma-70 family)